MAKCPVCAKCMVGWAIQETIKEYLMFIETLKAKQENAITKPLQALYAGQIEVFKDVIDDHKSLIPYLQNEANLRAKSDKGT